MKEEDKQDKKTEKQETALSFVRELFNTIQLSINQYATYVTYINYIDSKSKISDDGVLEDNEKNTFLNIITTTKAFLAKTQILFRSMHSKFSVNTEELKEINDKYNKIRDTEIPYKDDIEDYLVSIQQKLFDSVIGTILEDKNDAFDSIFK